MRQAFSLAIDRAALVNVVFNDMNVPTIQAVPADSPFYDADLKVPRARRREGQGAAGRRPG